MDEIVYITCGRCMSGTLHQRCFDTTRRSTCHHQVARRVDAELVGVESGGTVAGIVLAAAVGGDGHGGWPAVLMWQAILMRRGVYFAVFKRKTPP